MVPKGKGKAKHDKITGDKEINHSPATFICEAITESTHVVANGGPFSSTDDTDVLDRKNSKKEVLVGSVVPILVHLGEEPLGLVAVIAVNDLVELRLASLDGNW